MLKIERVLKQDRLLRAMSGLNRKAFDELLPTFGAVYEQRLVKSAKATSHHTEVCHPQDDWILHKEWFFV